MPVSRKNLVERLRWPLQAITAVALGSIMCACLPEVDSSWLLVASAVQCIEPTTGQSIFKSIGRALGACIGGALGLGVFYLVTWNMTVDLNTSLAGFLIWLGAVSLTVALSVLRLYIKDYTYVASYGVATGCTVIFGAWSDINYGRSERVNRRGVVRMVFITLGVVLATFVSTCILPNRARPRIVLGVADVMRGFAEVLAPLMVVEQHVTMHDLPAVEDAKAHIDETQEYSVRLQSAGDKLKKLDGLMTAARHEISCQTKNKFDRGQMKLVTRSIRTVHYQLSALCFSILRDLEKAQLESPAMMFAHHRVSMNESHSQVTNAVSNIVATLELMAQALEDRLPMDPIFAQLGFVDMSIGSLSQLNLERHVLLSKTVQWCADALEVPDGSALRDTMQAEVRDDSRLWSFLQDVSTLHTDVDRTTFWEGFFRSTHHTGNIKLQLRNLHRSLVELAVNLNAVLWNF
ncbi:MAG: uncharacterized protein KVP18_002005 [Porospora cf. gigantea A]|uniref:uncharacterized protein n=2 Tax=Porospora cf. gigantea A TaxID=2853593 RepID=UPI00355A4042|nr:MAG: hypothetical protein KVP18_002005 [Porospora cf. gigantea A]